MRTLVVGIGALGGVIAARLRASGAPVWLATRSADSAARLRESGLRVSGVGGDIAVGAPDAAPLDEFRSDEPFDLIVLATKARDAIALAPALCGMLAPGGTLLPVQNGGVSQMLAGSLGTDHVLGGLSNLGATMHAPGVFEQRNAGHLLIGELGGGSSVRAQRVREWLARGPGVRVTENLRGAIWSKLLLNCSVTTLGAISGRTMREYIGLPEGRELFDLAYDETLSVALANGDRPERMLVDPVPGADRDAWIEELLRAYGDLKASMLQDFERGRETEIDFINGYVADRGREIGVLTPVNEAIVGTVRAITRGELTPGALRLREVLERVR